MAASAEVGAVLAAAALGRPGPERQDVGLHAVDIQEEIDDTPLSSADARLFRGVAARLDYMGPDQPDMQYAIKEAARCMTSPRESDWALLEKIGKYLLHRPRVVMK